MNATPKGKCTVLCRIDMLLYRGPWPGAKSAVVNMISHYKPSARFAVVALACWLRGATLNLATDQPDRVFGSEPATRWRRDRNPDRQEAVSNRRRTEGV